MTEASAIAIELGQAFPSVPACEARGESGLRLGKLRRGARGRVIGISVASAHTRNAVDPHELERRLLEMGFVEGARFEILHEGPVRRDPIAVRLDETRVALRRREAHALIVEIDTDSPTA